MNVILVYTQDNKTPLAFESDNEKGTTEYFRDRGLNVEVVPVLQVTGIPKTTGEPISRTINGRAGHSPGPKTVPRGAVRDTVLEYVKTHGEVTSIEVAKANPDLNPTSVSSALTNATKAGELVAVRSVKGDKGRMMNVYALPQETDAEENAKTVLSHLARNGTSSAESIPAHHKTLESLFKRGLIGRDSDKNYTITDEGVRYRREKKWS